MSRDTTTDTAGMTFLESTPRKLANAYLPLGAFLFVLLFPFYWMAITAFKPNNELLSRDGNPFWVNSPTLDHVKKLLFDTAYPEWMWNTVLVSVTATFFSLAASVLAAYAIERLRFSGAKQVGLAIFLAYLVPPSILFIPLASVVFQLGLFDSRLALILTYPTFLIPFCTWLLMGYFRSIPFELEECALIDGATRWQIESGCFRRSGRYWCRQFLRRPVGRHPASVPSCAQPIRSSGTNFSRNLCLHTIVERIYLRLDVCLVVRAQDAASWRGH